MKDKIIFFDKNNNIVESVENATKFIRYVMDNNVVIEEVSGDIL